MGCRHYGNSKRRGRGVRGGRASRRLGPGVLRHRVGYLNLRVVGPRGHGSKNSDCQADHQSGRQNFNYVFHAFKGGAFPAV